MIKEVDINSIPGMRGAKYNIGLDIERFLASGAEAGIVDVGPKDVKSAQYAYRMHARRNGYPVIFTKRGDILYVIRTNKGGDTNG